jgi:hypothetical protein
MSLIAQRESTVYSYVGMTGSVPLTAETCLLVSGVRPTAADWHAAILVTSAASPLWADAVASKVGGTYYVARRIIGSFAGNDLLVGPGDYQQWLRLTGVEEQVVLICPVSVEVQ